MPLTKFNHSLESLGLECEEIRADAIGNAKFHKARNTDDHGKIDFGHVLTEVRGC